jgi:hypothetical protein
MILEYFKVQSIKQYYLFLILLEYFKNLTMTLILLESKQAAYQVMALPLLASSKFKPTTTL